MIRGMAELEASAFAIVLTTAGSEERARLIGRELVERGLAACVNVLSEVRSIYRWKGEVLDERERLLLIKTSVAKFEQVAAAIRELHTYEVPEILMLPLASGGAEYLAWLAESIEETPGVD